MLFTEKFHKQWGSDKLRTWDLEGQDTVPSRAHSREGWDITLFLEQVAHSNLQETTNLQLFSFLCLGKGHTPCLSL